MVKFPFCSKSVTHAYKRVWKPEIKFELNRDALFRICRLPQTKRPLPPPCWPFSPSVVRNQFADYSWRRTKRSYAGRWVPWVLTHGLSASGEYKRGWKLSSQNSLDLLCLCNKFSSLTRTCFIVTVFGKFCFVLKKTLLPWVYFCF